MKRILTLLAVLLAALPAAADSPMIYFGTHSKDLTANGLAYKNGSAATPSMSYLSAPSTGLFLDGSGNVAFSRLGTAGLSVGAGLSFPSTLVPVDSEGSLTQHTLQTSLNPAANVTTGSSRQLIALEQNIGTDDSGFSVDSASGLGVTLNSRNKSSWNNLFALTVSSQIGNGTDAQTGGSLTGAQISQTISDQADVGTIYGLQTAINAVSGSTLTNATGIRVSNQIDDATNYDAISVGDNLGTISSNTNGLNINTNIASGAGYHGVALSGTITAMSGGFSSLSSAYNLGTLAAGAQVFSDLNSITTVTAPSNYYSMSLTPNIGSTGGFAGIRLFPTIGVEANGVTGYEDGITVSTSGTSYNGLFLHPNLTGMTGSVNGVYVSPTATTSGSATGLYVNMSGVTAGGTKKAIEAHGDAAFDGNLSGGGGLFSFVSSPFTPINGGGNPSSVNLLISNMSVAPGSTTANADTIGLNTASIITLGAGSTTTSGPFGLGLASLALPIVLTTHAGSSLDHMSAIAGAVTLDPTSDGGTIQNVDVVKSIVVPEGGTTTIDNIRGFMFDLPFGDPGTKTWGVYVKPTTAQNWLSRSLKIGGTAGSTDVTSNASVGLEIEGTALYPQPMTTTTRDALTPLQGFVVNNSTTGNLERYDGAAWQTVSVGSFVPTTRTISTTAPLTGGGALSADLTLAMPVATAVADGYLSSADWSSFAAKQSALSFGNLTDAGTDGISVTGGTGAVIGAGTSLSQHVSDATHNGYLSSADWSSFNGKGTGTVTTASVVSANGFAGTVATATTTPAITLSTTVTGVLQGDGTAISAATTTGSGSVVLATSPTLVTPALGTPSAVVLTNATGLPAGTALTGQVPIANGGTGAATKAAGFDALSPLSTLGDILYGGASGTGTRLAGNTTAVSQFLVSTGTGAAATAPTFRAIATGDIPTTITAATTFTNGVVLGTPLAVGSGGTGSTTSTGSGSVVLQTSPTLTTPVITGVTDGSAAAAGKVGEILECHTVRSAGIALADSTVANICSISVTAGDWEFKGGVGAHALAGTSVTSLNAGISLTSATLPVTDDLMSPASGEVRGKIGGSTFVGDAEIPVNLGSYRYTFSGAAQTVFLVTLPTCTGGTCTTLSGYGYFQARRMR